MGVLRRMNLTDKLGEDFGSVKLHQYDESYKKWDITCSNETGINVSKEGEVVVILMTGVDKPLKLKRKTGGKHGEQIEKDEVFIDDYNEITGDEYEKIASAVEELLKS